jgi:hypothetical protein
MLPDTLIDNLISANNFDRETELSEIRNLYKLSIWHFAPGVSYDFIRNRYYLTVSTSGLVNHFVNKKQETRRIGAIERKYKAKNLSDELKVHNIIRAIEADYRDILLNHQATEIEIETFMINKQQYEQNEIDTEKYLNAKASIINKIKQHNSTVTAMYKSILTLSDICNTPIPADLKQLYFTLQFLEE